MEGRKGWREGEKREGGRKGSCMLDKQQCYGVEKEMAAQSSILAWRIPRTEDPGGLQSMGLQRVRHGRVTKRSTVQCYGEK